MSEKLFSILSKLGGVFRDTIHRHEEDSLADCISYQQDLYVGRVIATMLDLNIPDEKIIEMLQKHWDFRLSEATRSLQDYKSWSQRRK